MFSGQFVEPQQKAEAKRADTRSADVEGTTDRLTERQCARTQPG